MSKKVDFPELRAQLEALNNKELHYKCVEHGMNIPVADSTRDVIIRKLIKTITGGATAASPKVNKKQKSTPNERRKTVNVTLHVSSDEEELERERQQFITKNRPRTQSPKGHNVSFDTSVNNNERSIVAPVITKKQQGKVFDANANVGVGLSNNARIIPIEMEHDDYNIEVRQSGPGNKLNKNANLNQGYNFSGKYSATQQSENHGSGYKGTTSNLDFNQSHVLSNTYMRDQTETPISAYKAASPNLGFSQTRTLNTTYQQDENASPKQCLFSSPQEHTINRPFGFYNAGSPTTSFNIENMASHSSTQGGRFLGSSPNVKEPLFKRPTALSKSNVTTTTYNQADAQRLYPRLPTDLITAPSYTSSPSSMPNSQQATHSGRAPSLSKSGVMTTSYYQEITPVKEVKHFEVENGDEPADDGAGDCDRSNVAAGTKCDRSSYLAGIQHGAEANMPFEPHLQSTLRDPLYSSPRYNSSPLARETYVPSAAASKAPSSPKIKSYSTTTRFNTSYTRSIDEPDSGSEGEKLSGDEIYVQDSEEEEYLADAKKIYSSYGSNKIQERVPYRRSNTARLSAAPMPRYSQSPAGLRSLNPDNDDDDVNESLKNFIATLDRKYHIKQMMYMFAIFAGAVFIYVFFIEKTPMEDDDVLVDAKVQP